MAMARPTAQTVRGDFGDTAFTHSGQTTRFSMRDGKYLVSTEGPDGKRADFEVAYTFGVEPLQQYLIALPGGRLQALQVAWDTARSRWFHLMPDEKTPPGDVLHWTGAYQTANTMCLSCHTTGFEKKYDEATGSFASHWSEPNVSCQSCHGPGERHVAWAKDKAGGKGKSGAADAHFGLTVSASLLAGKRQVDVCASCHSRRSELSPKPAPGEPRLDNYLTALLTEGLYHADGQQLDEVFEDGSFRQSRMFEMGVTCTSCHNPHSGKLKAAGNAVCTQCHSTPGNAAFPSAARVYDSPAHHFHKAGSAGAQCVACHMPTKTYMQVQARRDHALRSPRPDLTVKLGTPNACNQCHADRSAQWAAKQVAQWYGPARAQTEHYGEILALARGGHPTAGPSLTRLAADLKQPAIVRATALDALGGVAGGDVDTRIRGTRDTDPHVRAAAADSFQSTDVGQHVASLAPLLKDRVRAVRMAAAHTLSVVSRSQLPPESQAAFDAALAEYVAAQSVAVDMPGARLNLAVIHQNIGKAEVAERHYLAALRIDPDFTPARANLAGLYNSQLRNADARRVLSEGLKRNPAIGELQYSLGLLLAEDGKLPEAAEALAQASRLMPQRARVHYNLGLALQQLGRRKPAEAALLKARSVDPGDAQLTYALVVFYAQGGQREPTMRWFAALQQMAQTDPEAQQLLGALRTGG